MPVSALQYIRQLSAAMEAGYTGDCLAHAYRVAELLLAEARAPWIGRIRHIEQLGAEEFRGYLLPLRYAGHGMAAWTTHYVACAGGEAFDPLVGEPAGIDTFSELVFGKALPVVVHLDEAETERLLRQRTSTMTTR